MSPKLFLLRAVEPGLSLLPGYMVSDTARVLLMAIAGQESNWEARAQSNDGPALGYWQFQIEAVNQVISAQFPLASAVLTTLNVKVVEAHAALQYNDPLACAFARLLLWDDPAPLPAIGSELALWTYYLRVWKPGKPDITRWSGAYAAAISTLGITSQGISLGYSTEAERLIL
jgi:hypothetical protein